MRRLLKLIPLLSLLTLAGCEKDDICDTTQSTTPRLIISFYDVDNPTILKPVTNLRVIAEGSETPLQTFNGVSKIELPLKTTDDLTQYNLYYNYADENQTGNLDQLIFNYSRENVYVSRACGYKTAYSLNQPGGAVHVSEPNQAQQWIKTLIVNQPNISTENETHVSILF